IAKGSGAPLHNQTFSQHPVSCAAGLAALGYIRANKLIDRCARMGLLLHEKLRETLELPHIGDVRGRGLFAGIEFVKDKQTRTPFPRRVRFAEIFTEAAQAAGLVVWPNTGQADGTDGDLVVIGPPFVITEDEISEIVRLFQTALETAVSQVDRL
ncbi:MAG: aminotransferase class III-fold pyridoxal phosphate-dependent enzyme, partial [bacterium]